MADLIETAPYPTGWWNRPLEVARVANSLPYPRFSAAAPNLKGTGAGKTTLLYKAWKDVLGSYFPYPNQLIGCCVSRGWSEGIDLLQCVQIALGHKTEQFQPTSHEAIYGMARVDIGGEKGSYEDGAVGAWAAKAVSTIGTLSQAAVGFDYDDKICKEWGAKGVPATLQAKAKDHLVGTTSLVTTLEELDDALANGYPVPECSNQGFTMTRDTQGFCRASGHWSHCQLWCGVRKDEHPGYCLMQSWGMDTPTGPLTLDQPPNSFWVDPVTAGRMLAAQDSFLISAFHGYPATVLPTTWSYKEGWI